MASAVYLHAGRYRRGWEAPVGLFDNLKDSLGDAVGFDADQLVEATEQVAEVTDNVSDTAESARDTWDTITGE
jgi:hypothetical protein